MGILFYLLIIQLTVDLTDISLLEPSPPPLRSEVEVALKSLKSNQSPGPDELQAELLKVKTEVVTDLCHRITTAAWQKEYFPKTRYSATIILLHKKGSKAECDNYRPISLTIQHAKLLTKIPLDRIKVLTSHIIPKCQAGFRANCSTIDQIFVIRQEIEKYLEYGQELYQFFIDFKQAFDLIWREGLWHILLFYGVPSSIVSLIRNMYELFRAK